MYRRASVHVCVCLNYNVVFCAFARIAERIISERLSAPSRVQQWPLVQGSAAIAYVCTSPLFIYIYYTRD